MNFMDILEAVKLVVVAVELKYALMGGVSNIMSTLSMRVGLARANE